ncbi:MAG: prolipoprotein diacylglyceryl transferase [Verrucomicrobia bacterium]|nr:prolipoprotein diacylglyceryl transferase [Verrucomicrobiota bacterium]
MPPLLAYFVHTPHPFLIQFTETFGIRYYGIGYMLGFLTGGWLLWRYAKAGRSQLPVAQISDLMVALVIGVMLGGRLGIFLLYKPAELLADPLSFFRVWEGGMASHGGFMGVAAAMAWFAYTRKIRFLHLADLVTSAAPPGLLVVRIANYLNGELWGKVTDVSWGVIFERTGGGPHPRHPSQLYEAALEGGLLLIYLQWRFWRSDVVRQHPGRLAGEFLLGYAIVRAICEIFREPDVGVSPILGLSRGTFYSIFVVIAGVWLIARRSKPLETAKKV